jgi:hypothetical protein
MIDFLSDGAGVLNGDPVDDKSFGQITEVNASRSGCSYQNLGMKSS